VAIDSAERVRLGSRGSKLSLWQAQWVALRLASALPGRRIEIIPITTRGDVDQRPFTGLEVPGVFTSELETALADGSIDLAVHSLKDLPVSVPGALEIAAVPLRADPADGIVSREGFALATLPTGARVGTSSPRRTALVRAARPDLEIVSIRGNVDTRVRRVDEGAYDAIVLAVAGLERLGLQARISERLDPHAFPPAPGQGALAVQVGGATAAKVRAAIAAMDDPAARATVTAERACLRELGGGCSRPIGAHATCVVDGVELTAVVGSLDGTRSLRASASGRDPDDLGARVARILLEDGAAELLG
jgi:hydroxymethylbilane synthase